MVERSGARFQRCTSSPAEANRVRKRRRLHCRQDTASNGTPAGRARIHASGAGFPELFIFMSHPLALFRLSIEARSVVNLLVRLRLEGRLVFNSAVSRRTVFRGLAGFLAGSPLLRGSRIRSAITAAFRRFARCSTPSTSSRLPTQDHAPGLRLHGLGR